MKKYIIIIFGSLLFASTGAIHAQQKQELTLDLSLDQAIELAQKQSIESFRSKNMYLSKYWEFRSYKASRLPGLVLRGTPLSYNESYRLVETTEGDQYVKNNALTSTGTLSLSQNLALTGGTVSIQSSLQRIDDYQYDTRKFVSRPYEIVLDQPLNGYNSFRWDAKIDPLKFEIAKRVLVQDLEDLALNAISNFFNAASAEINVKIAETNYQNADTLLRIGRGRFEIGTVTQDDLLDLELSFLNAKIELTKSKLNLRQTRIRLNSFLRLDENIVVKCLLPHSIPNMEVEFDKALDLAIANNPEQLSYEQMLLQANEAIARARSTSGLSASLTASLGVNQTSTTIDQAYQQPFDDYRGVGVTFRVPLLDWGYRHGQIQMAKSQRDVTDAQVQQARIDFEQSILQNIMEFNLQSAQVEIAAKADTIAQLGFDVTKQRFMIDKVDVIKLNSARNSLDAARRSYVDALRRYWNYYYTVRKMTLHDFTQEKNLMDDFDKMIAKP
jgi:outer membrane protein TolC